MAKKVKNRTATRRTRIYESAPPEPMGVPVTFTLDGFKYICRELGPLELSEMARMHGRAADDPASMAFMAELFETLLGRAEYLLFRQRCGQFQTRPEMFIAIIQGIFEDFADRPTGPPSDSLPGRQSIGENSTDDSSSRAMALLEKRPDLQMAVLAAQEDKSIAKIPKNRLTRE